MMKKNYGSEQNIYRLFACSPSMAPAAVAAGAWKKTCEFGFAHYVIRIIQKKQESNFFVLFGF